MDSSIITTPEGGVAKGRLGTIKGFFSGLYSKIKSLKSASDNKEKFSLMEQLRGISQFIWLASFIFTVFVLYKYFSPVITKLAMESSWN
jgi:predicted MFS family arabinose efflux permease